MANDDQELVIIRAVYAETPQAIEIELPRGTTIEDARKVAFIELQKKLHDIQKHVNINLDDAHTEILPVGKSFDPLCCLLVYFPVINCVQIPLSVQPHRSTQLQ